MRAASSRVLVVLATGLAAAATATAQQSPLHSPHLSLYPEVNFYDFKIAHLGDDTVPDLLFSTIIDNVREADGDGVGGILATTDVVDEGVLSIATGDLDGDGRDDCAFLPLSGAQVSVRLNLGGGAWGQGPVLGTYTKPSTLAIADLDLDGHLDVLAANHGLKRLQWFMNLGDAQFAAPVDVECAQDSLALAIGDVDADGWPDVASASDVIGSATVVVTRSDGAGGFLHPDVLAKDIVLQPGDTLLIGDVDSDGVGDVLLADAAQGVAEFRGQPGEEPRPPLFLPTLLPCQSLATGDFDGDGQTDLSAGQHGGLVTNFVQSLGLLVAQRQFAAAVGPVFEHAADFDLDGNVDVITGNGQVLTPLMGRGLGDFRPCYGFEAQPIDLALGDHDGDGYPDAVVTLMDGSATLLSGLPGDCLGRSQSVDLGPAPLRAFFAQANGDPVPDVIALQAGGGNDGIAVMLGDGQNGFLPPVLYPVPASVKGGAVGDLDLDHLTDVVVLRDEAGAGSVDVLLAAGGGTYVQGAVQPLAARPIDAEIGDMDEDGQPDVVVLVDGGLSVLLGTGGGGLAPPIDVATASNGVDLIVRDFDSDGHLDAVVARTLDSKVRVHYGNGDGTFQPPIEEGVRVKPTGLDAGDLDAEGTLDLLVTGLVDVTLPGSIAVLPGQHGGGFGEVSLAASSSDAGRPEIADLDLDGRLDAALLIPKGQQLDLYSNVDGTWAPLGHSLAGTAGYSRLIGTGPLTPGSPIGLLVDGATPLAPALLIAGFDAIDLPFKGGVLVPAPSLLVSGLASGASGELSLGGTWPAGVPSGTTLVAQTWFVDAGGPHGFSATTAVQGTVP